MPISRDFLQLFDILDRSRGVPAILGDGAGNVEHPRIAKRVWIRVFTASGQVRLATAYNSAVTNREGLLVYVKPTRKQGRRVYEIVGEAKLDLYPEREGIYEIPAHAWTHRWPYGTDIVSINHRQLEGLRVRQQNTPGMTLQVDIGWYERDGVKYFAGGNSPAFTAPTGVYRWDLLVIGLTDALTIEQGTENTWQNVAIPLPTAGVVPLCAVLLTAGQTAIVETSLRDLRYMPGPSRGSITQVQDCWATDNLYDGAIYNAAFWGPG